eukprot:TRINITY_DN8254_c0_g2_i1.p1 TRINITY_DN8254_c0_g2~~TRINITY_DN8254_c0_g2_i1.p1  ORF type:complete len:569 (-),score=81.45 TRINITY_DN8254_c0_g2_i1:68-1774(-)
MKLSIPRRKGVPIIAKRNLPRNMEKKTEDAGWKVPHHFITSFEYLKGNFVAIGFASGAYELRDGSNLSVIASCCPPPQPKPFTTNDISIFKENDEPTSSHSKRRKLNSALHPTMLPSIPFFPIASCISPHGVCICVLHNNVELCLYVIDAEVVLGSKEDDKQARRFTDMMELSLLKGTGWWDILLLFREMSIHRPDAFKTILPMLIADHKSLTPIYRHYYSPRVEGLKACIYRLTKGQEYNYCDSQARLFIYQVYDTFRSLFISFGMPKASVSINKEADSLFKQPELYTVDRDVIDSLLPVTEWVMNYVVFLFRNLEHFVKTHTTPDSSTSSKLPESADYQSFFSLHYNVINSYAPGISFLFDLQFIVLVRELVLYSGNIRILCMNNNPALADKLNATYKISDAKALTDVFTKLICKLKECLDQPVVNTNKYLFLLSKMRTDFEAVFNLSQKNLSAIPAWSMKMDTLFHSLDLHAPYIGFLEQNQLPRHPVPKDEEDFQYKYHSVSSVNVASVHDVVTYAKFEIKNRPFRQCIRCHRTTILTKDGTAHWHSKWEFMCPICGGRWKVVK